MTNELQNNRNSIGDDDADLNADRTAMIPDIHGSIPNDPNAILADHIDTRDKSAQEQMSDNRAVIEELSSKVSKLEEHIEKMMLDKAIADMDLKEDLVDENADEIEQISQVALNILGTGYNKGPRYKSDGSYDIFGRYMGPFYAECREVTTGTTQLYQGSTNTRYPPGGAKALRFYAGRVHAGNSMFHWPNNDDGILFREWSLNGITIGGDDNIYAVAFTAGTWYPYIEVAVAPHAPHCDQLWVFNSIVNGSQPYRYAPILRIHKDTVPNQRYSFSDATLPSDCEFIQDHAPAGEVTAADPRLMALRSNDDVLVAKYILGKLTIGQIGAGLPDAGEFIVTKWEPWHDAGDIYTPVWQWWHCTDEDGIQDYPDADTGVCVYGASLCSPTCFTPWGLFTDHFHLPLEGVWGEGRGSIAWKDSTSTQTGFPLGRQSCDLSGEGLGDNQGGG